MKNVTKIYGLLSLLFCFAFNPIVQGYTEYKNTIIKEVTNTSSEIEASHSLEIVKEKDQYRTGYASIYNENDQVYLNGSGMLLIGFLAFIGLGLFYYLFLLIVDVNKTHAKFKEQSEKLRNLKNINGFGKLKLKY